MYRKQRKIPTLLALFILFAGIGLTVYFDGTFKQLTTNAEDLPSPADVHITNITDNSLSLSFLTEKAVITSVSVSGEGVRTSLLDERDSDGNPRERTQHVFSVKNLHADREYTLKIFSGGSGCPFREKCPEFVQKTGVPLPASLLSFSPSGSPKSFKSSLTYQY